MITAKIGPDLLLISLGLQYTVFFFYPTCHARKTCCELSRVRLYRNHLKGNKNNFELAGGSSYRRFELPRVKLQ